MSFNEHRDPSTISETQEFNIERLSYDVFAYMLRVCGFSEEKIPSSGLRENIYDEPDFLMNVGLSALPIALYKRDEWKLKFEDIVKEVGLDKISELTHRLESLIFDSGELDEEDVLSKMQYSLALYSEFTLFLNFIGNDDYLQSLPEVWSRLCKKLAEENEVDSEALDIPLTMCPEVSESWMRDFITDFAIPYGSDCIFDRFSLYTLKYKEENEVYSEETSTENIFTKVSPQKSTIEPIVHKDGNTTVNQEGSNLESNYVPGTLCRPSSSIMVPMSAENVPVKKRTWVRRTNGIAYVLQQCLKAKKRNVSEGLEVEDAFGDLNLDKENIPPENRGSKRRRKISDYDNLE